MATTAQMQTASSSYAVCKGWIYTYTYWSLQSHLIVYLLIYEQ